MTTPSIYNSFIKACSPFEIADFELIEKVCEHRFRTFNHKSSKPTLSDTKTAYAYMVLITLNDPSTRNWDGAEQTPLTCEAQELVLRIKNIWNVEQDIQSIMFIVKHEGTTVFELCKSRDVKPWWINEEL